jgi:hypothetical protein
MPQKYKERTCPKSVGSARTPKVSEAHGPQKCQKHTCPKSVGSTRALKSVGRSNPNPNSMLIFLGRSPSPLFFALPSDEVPCSCFSPLSISPSTADINSPGLSSRAQRILVPTLSKLHVAPSLYFYLLSASLLFYRFRCARPIRS